MASKTPRKSTSDNHFGTPKTSLPTLVSPPISSRLRSRSRKTAKVEEAETLTPLAKKRTISTPAKTQPVKRVSEEVSSLIKTPKTATRKRTKFSVKEKSESLKAKDEIIDEQPSTPDFVSPPLVKRLRSCSRKSGQEVADSPVITKEAKTPQRNLTESLQRSIQKNHHNVVDTNEGESEDESESESEEAEEMEQQNKESSTENDSESEEDQSELVTEEQVEISSKTNNASAQEDSDSDSDNDAPEAVSLSSSKSMALQAKKQEREAVQKITDQKRQKRREIDARFKEQKAAKKDRTAKQALPLIEIQEEEVPKPLEIPSTLPLEMLEMVADMDEELPKKRNHIKMEEFESLFDDEQKSKKVKGEKSFGTIKVISLTSQPKIKPIPESILDFKSKHFFGNRVNRKSSVLNMSQRRSVAIKFRRL